MARLILKARHRIMCGDSTSPQDVATLTKHAVVDACLTDPPYGIGDTKSAKNNYDTFVDTKENLSTLVSNFFPIARKMCRVVVITPGNQNQRIYPEPNWTMAWFTPAGSGSGPWGFCCWQPILCYGKDPKLAAGKGRHPDAIVHTESAEKSVHPCPKPVNFWSWLMERVTEPGQTVFEPFSGSGTGIIAAEKTNRNMLAMEISPTYVDVAVMRWQDYTGREAIHEATGKTFSEIADGKAQS